jgi:hypothetical protein
MRGAVKAHQFDQLVDAVSNDGGVLAEQAGGNPDVLGHGHVWEQADALEYVADAAAQHDRVDDPDVLAGNPDRPLGRVDQPVDQAKQRGLAGPGGADDGQEFLRADRK